MNYETMPLAIIDYPADAVHRGEKRKVPPRFIYLHATGGKDSRRWLSTTSVPPVSCHRLIAKDGTIYKIVPDDEIAYTQGNGVMGQHKPYGKINCNEDGLSIEIENMDDGKDPFTARQYAMVAAQVDEWHGKYGYLPMLCHFDVDPAKVDPKGFDSMRLYRMLRALSVNSPF